MITYFGSNKCEFYQKPHLISLDAGPVSTSPPILYLESTLEWKRCSNTRSIWPAVSLSRFFSDPKISILNTIFSITTTLILFLFFLLCFYEITITQFHYLKYQTLSYGPAAGSTVSECWRKVRVALGPGLVIRVTMNDPRWELSGRFHLGPSRTLAWVFIGGLSWYCESS